MPTGFANFSVSHWVFTYSCSCWLSYIMFCCNAFFVYKLCQKFFCPSVSFTTLDHFSFVACTFFFIASWRSPYIMAVLACSNTSWTAIGFVANLSLQIKAVSDKLSSSTTKVLEKLWQLRLGPNFGDIILRYKSVAILSAAEAVLDGRSMYLSFPSLDVCRTFQIFFGSVTSVTLLGCLHLVVNVLRHCGYSVYKSCS